MNKFKRIISLLMIITILISLVPPQKVEASDANFMTSQMINFFKDLNSIDDVKTLSPDEVRAYAVFITNFMKPGAFVIEDLNKGADSELVKQVADKFFGGGDSKDKETISGINKIIYNSIMTDLNDGQKCNLYSNTTTKDNLSGKDLLNKMYFVDYSDTTENELKDTIVYFGPNRAVSMDMSKPAIRGAFKILASYSMDFMIGENGLANMSALFIDGFGNIWGEYVVDLAITEHRSIVTTISKNEMVLVLPACLNPLAFTSFANHEINGVAKPTQSNLKLPLNNAFAMGAFIRTNGINNAFDKNIAPIYNLYSYLAIQDKTNLLNIFGVSSPMDAIGRSNNFQNEDFYFDRGLVNYFKNSMNTINPSGTYIMLANNMQNVIPKLNKATQKMTGITNKVQLVDYLFDTMTIPISQVADTLYYFSSSGAIGWKDDFKDMGMLGASLFMDTEETFYSSSARINGITTQLSKFYGELENKGINLSTIDTTDISFSNLKKIKEISDIARNYFTSTIDKVDVVPKPSSHKLMLYLKYLDMYGFTQEILNSASEDVNFKMFLDNADLLKNTLTDATFNIIAADSNIGTLGVYGIDSYISAVCYLMGATIGESNTKTKLVEYRAPHIFNVGGISETNKIDKSDSVYGKGIITEVPYYFGLEDADHQSYTELNSDKSFFSIGNESSYIYGLGYYDGTASNIVREVWTTYNYKIPNAPNNLFTNFNVYTLFSSHNITLSTTLVADAAKNTEAQKVRTSVGGKEIVYSIDNYIADGVNNWPGIFFGYLVDILQMDIATRKATGSSDETLFDCYSFISDFLPTATIDVTGSKLDMSNINAESGLSTSDAQTMEETQKDLIKKIYGLVSNENNEYRNSLLKSTIDGFLLTIHRNITGSWLADMSSVSAGNGSTYQGVVGYIHTPSLDDLPFTSWIMQNYMQIYVLLLLLISMFLVIMVLLKIRDWRQGTAIFMFMCIALLLPNILLGNTINITNKFTDNLYSDKFDFWAMTQHQQSLDSLNGLSKGSKEGTIAMTMQKAEEIYSSDAGVRIKWMSPKKSSLFNSMYSNTNMSESFATNLTIFKWLFSSFIYESEFVSNDPLATYLYRPYNSITRVGQQYYDMSKSKIINTSNGSETKISAFNVAFKDKANKTVNTEVSTYRVVSDVYTASKKSERGKDYSKMFYAALIDDSLLKRNNFMDIYYNDDKIADISAVDTYNTSVDKDSVALWGMGSQEINEVMFKKAVKSNTIPLSEVGVESNLTDSIDTDTMYMSDAHKAAFLLNTESPYYYFYNTLKYRYGAGGDFKNSLLNIEVFKVNGTTLTTTSKSPNNKIRDFLDLEGLFTYMIPYLTICNDYVYDWTNINGTSVSSYNFESDDEENLRSDSSYKQDNIKKQEMSQVWNMYSPWVDQLNSLDINNKKVKVGTKTLRIENTLNPSYYLIEGRPMIFSEVDMIAKGYRTNDLTDVEMRIQKVLETTYEDLMYLANYYDMDNEVLLSAAAMYATFNFNREFSQTELLGDSVMIYPQSFEMKNFNHDAFMRLALLNATGETVFGEKDLFERVLQKTSVFTGILLLVEDVVAIIIIPTLKFIVLLMLLFLGLLVCVSCVLTPPEKIVQTLSKTIVLPTMLFMLSTIVFAWLVSLLVGDGLSAYVGSKSITISTNDPTITVLFLIVLGVIYIIVLLKLIKMMFESFKSYGMSSIFAGVGLVGSGVGHVIRKVGNTVKGGTLNALLPGPGKLTRFFTGAFDGATNGALSNTAAKFTPYGGMVKSANNKLYGTDRKAFKVKKDLSTTINEKASKNSVKLNNIPGLQQIKNKEDTVLDKALNSVVYKGHKALDSGNELKHSVMSRIEEAKSTVRYSGETIKKVTTGEYFGQSIDKIKERNTQYNNNRVKLDTARKNIYAPKTTFKAVDKMRAKQ